MGYTSGILNYYYYIMYNKTEVIKELLQDETFILFLKIAEGDFLLALELENEFSAELKTATDKIWKRMVTKVESKKKV